MMLPAFLFVSAAALLPGHAVNVETRLRPVRRAATLLLSATESGQKSADAGAESIDAAPTDADTIFTLQTRSDGWDDVRDAILSARSRYSAHPITHSRTISGSP